MNYYKITFTLIACLVCVYLYFPNNNLLLFLAASIGIAGVFSESLNHKIAMIWMKLGEILGLIFPKIIFTLIYYFVLTPIALASKIFRKKEVIQIKNKHTGLWKDVNKNFPKAAFEKMW